MNKIANSWWMYLLGTIVFLFVLITCFIFIIRAIKDAKKLNMDKKIIKQTIINSAIFTILPSISILIGIITLSGVIGIPLPWIRLSVIGALHYEGSAIEAAYSNITSLSLLTKVQFVTIAFVMTLGILSGPVYCLFGFKAYDKKLLSKARIEFESSYPEKEEIVEETSTPTQKKKAFGPVLFDAVFIAMICSFLAEDIAKLGLIGKYNDSTSKNYNALETYIPFIVILVSFASMFIIDSIQKKFKLKWLASFDLGLSMIIGMTVAVLLG